MPHPEGAPPRGARPAPGLTEEVRRIYAALTGEACDVEVYLSQRMATRTAGIYRQAAGMHQIVLSARYLALASREQREDLIRHELAHYRLALRGYPREGHGGRFRGLMRVWGFSRFPDPAILRRIADGTRRLRHLYVCPRGHEHWLPRHPRRRAVSCGLCAKTFDDRYRLRYGGVSREA